MQNLIIEFPYNSRITYFAIKNMFRKKTGFSSLNFNDSLYVIKGRHGALISPFSESIVLEVTATSNKTCKLTIKSSSRSILNLLNINANKDNISILKNYVSNEVYKLMQLDEIPIKQESVRIIPTNIKFK